ncbi:MAG: hypothetical protein KDC98_23900 [Planctomycetes bacterium]|nr:hypothetical protein [Planctomycetota bacterium]
MKTTDAWLDGIAIASPCSTDWNQMQGDARCRFCSQCNLHVFDLSAMTRPEAEALVRSRTGTDGGQRLCVRFTRRADGTVLTRDCPVGLRQRMRRTGARIVAACAALLAFAGCRRLAQPDSIGGSDPSLEQPLQGDVVPPPPLMGTPAPTAPEVMGRVRIDDPKDEPPK